MQNKQAEIQFFDAFAEQDQYDVFTPESNHRLIRTCIQQGGLQPGWRIADLGSGSGVFTRLLQDHGLTPISLDISFKLLKLGRSAAPDMDHITGDVEWLPFRSNSLDGVLLSGILHHLPQLDKVAAEVYRVLRPGGRFVAFDPNRRNPFMWLYRDRSSPLYSNKGVTENERPIVAQDVAQAFQKAGFQVSINYLSGLEYRYVASPRARMLLPVYNQIERLVFSLPLLKPFNAFVISSGIK